MKEQLIESLRKELHPNLLREKGPRNLLQDDQALQNALVILAMIQLQVESKDLHEQKGLEKSE
jgi:hypothetical protein